jgi:hypothetical protein
MSRLWANDRLHAAQVPIPAAHLASASRDPALETASGGELSAQAQEALALLLVQAAVRLVPEPQRPGFLFLSWQTAAAALSPHERVQIAARADRYGPERTRRAADHIPRGGDVEAAWRRYVETAQNIVATDDRTGPPTNYLLFEHARQTHTRLGIPAATESFAARAVRVSLRAGVTEPARELQSV